MFEMRMFETQFECEREKKWIRSIFGNWHLAWGRMAEIPHQLNDCVLERCCFCLIYGEPSSKFRTCTRYVIAPNIINREDCKQNWSICERSKCSWGIVWICITIRGFCLKYLLHFGLYCSGHTAAAFFAIDIGLLFGVFFSIEFLFFFWWKNMMTE